MSWEKNLSAASYKGVPFECLRTTDATAHATASYEYPYIAGADSEDMGRGARKIAITAVLFGDDYDKRLSQLIAVLDQPDAGELLHPVFGSMATAQIIDYQVEHDADNRNYCTIAMHFAEVTRANPLFEKKTPESPTDKLIDNARQTRAACVDGFGMTIRDLSYKVRLVTEKFQESTEQWRQQAQIIVGSLRQARASILTVVNGIKNNVRQEIQDIVDPLRELRNDVRDLVQEPLLLAHEFKKTFEDIRAIPQEVKTNAMSEWRKVNGTLKGVADLPRQIASQIKQDIENPRPTPNRSGASGAAGAIPARQNMATPNATPTYFSATMTAVTAAYQAEFAGQILRAEISRLTLSPDAIKEISNDTRRFLQEAINQIRAAYPVERAYPLCEKIRSLAHDMQTAALQLIEQRPPLIQRVVTVPGNLHLQAFRWYQDAARGAELARLNPQLRNPNFVAQGEILHAYAK